MLFEGTGNVLQESANFFWDNTNARLGVGTAAPVVRLEVGGDVRIVGSGSTSATTVFGIYNINYQELLRVRNDGLFIFNTPSNILIGTSTNAGYKLDVNGTARVQGALTAALSANAGSNPNLLVQTTNGDSSVLRVQNTEGFGLITTNNGVSNLTNNDIALSFQNGIVGFRIGAGGGGIGPNSSAILDIVSTNRGFLPPRMTNAQRLAIASPAVGLIVYCTDAVEGLYINKSTGWTFVI